MKKLLLSCLIFFLFFSLSEEAYASRELLVDPNFENGVAIGYANNYPNDKDLQCIGNWRNKLINYNQIKWYFIEISERFYLCDNNNNPIVSDSSINYISPNYGGKQLLIDKVNKSVRMLYNTGWEWRGGCNLCKPWTFDGITHYPQYGNSLTFWPHFLVAQFLSSSYVPSPDFQGLNSVPVAERVEVNKSEGLIFHGEFKLNNSQKVNSRFNCPNGDWLPNTCNQELCQGGNNNCPQLKDHAIFYVGFVLWRKNQDPNKPPNYPNVLYQLLPLVYTEDGNINLGGDGYNGQAYFLGDQFGDRTFFAKFGEGSTKNVKKLVKGQWTSIEIDVREFSKETLGRLNPNINFSDYFVSSVLIGWEIWGGYQTDVEFRNLSLIDNSLSGISDINGDGKVDIFDYNILVSDFGKTGVAGFVKSDINKDGKVDIFDYNILISNFGK